MKNLLKNNQEDNLTGEKMLQTCKYLFPKNRSLMGPDIRESYRTFQDLHQEFKKIIFNTGQKVFDWEVPEEWIINDAYLEHESGRKFAEFKKNNLHLVGYSIGINKLISKEDLASKLYSLPEMPDAIPYITSYYKDNWGFCISDNERKKLKNGSYKVIIKSQKMKGKLYFGETFIKGKINKEILISCNICHPQMANDDISGPAVSTFISKWLSLRNNYYSYRVIYIPETIGSIVYISKNYSRLKKNLIAGYTVTNIGGLKNFSFVSTKDGNTLSDKAARIAIKTYGRNGYEYGWEMRGSDERQFGSPKLNLPISSLMRTHHSKFREYHTSEDKFNKTVTPKSLNDGYNFVKKVLEIIDSNFIPLTIHPCEPFLSNTKIYSSISLSNQSKKVINILNIISYMDGKNSVIDISIKLGMNYNTVLEIVEVLLKHKKIKKKHISNF